MKILGISPFHDSSVCVVQNHKVLSFYKEERLSKIKRNNHPYLSLEEIFSEHSDIDMAIIASPSNGDSSLESYKNYLLKSKKIKSVEDMSDRHHLQHASLAFYNSGFKKSLVFVIDRNGSIFLNCRESESVFIAEYPNKFQELYKNFWASDAKYLQESINFLSEKYKDFPYRFEIDVASTHGIVKVYESATSLIEQHPLENGKVMGLAAYGEHKEKYNDLFFDRNLGNIDILGHEYCENFERSINKNLHQYKTNDINKTNFQLYADYAFAVQFQTQIASLEIIKKYVYQTNIKDICITGGYALNVVANEYFQTQLPDCNFYFEPLADDTGNSIGAAFYLNREISKSNDIFPLENTFFHGKKYALEKINGTTAEIEGIGDLLINQNSVALYYEKAEAGPRALGHRSLLFDPRNSSARDIINVTKKREWYRPFAASMLKEDALKFFNINFNNNYCNMTVNARVQNHLWKFIPGVIHVDGSCRIQIVNEISEPLFQLLQEFKKKTGIGILLNTSFNLAGDALVETPEDAIFTWKNSSIDVLWFPEIKTYLKNKN